MTIPANQALVPYRPFMTVCAAEFDDSATIRTYATREACEDDLYAWADALVGPYEPFGWFTPPGVCEYVFAAYEHGELRHWRCEGPQGGSHFGPWPEEEEAALRRATADQPWPF